MSPDTKLIIDELNKRFSEHDDKLEKRFNDLDTKREKHFATSDKSRDARATRLEKVPATFETWQPDIEGTVDDIKLEVRKLNKHLERVIITNPPSNAGLFELPSSASARRAHLPEFKPMDPMGTAQI